MVLAVILKWGNNPRFQWVSCFQALMMETTATGTAHASVLVTVCLRHHSFELFFRNAAIRINMTIMMMNSNNITGIQSKGGAFTVISCCTVFPS